MIKCDQVGKPHGHGVMGTSTGKIASTALQNFLYNIGNFSTLPLHRFTSKPCCSCSCCSCRGWVGAPHGGSGRGPHSEAMHSPMRSLRAPWFAGAWAIKV